MSLRAELSPRQTVSPHFPCYSKWYLRISAKIWCPQTTTTQPGPWARNASPMRPHSLLCSLQWCWEFSWSHPCTHFADKILRFHTGTHKTVMVHWYNETEPKRKKKSKRRGESHHVQLALWQRLTTMISSKWKDTASSVSDPKKCPRADTRGNRHWVREKTPYPRK